MIKYKATIFLISLATIGFSQGGVGINTTGTAPNGSSMLDIASTDKGLLIPRIPLTSTTDITTITNGNVLSLMVFNTATVADVTPGYYYWDGTVWKTIGGGDDADADPTNEIELPTGGTIGQVLVTDGNGNYTWVNDNAGTDNQDLSLNGTTLSLTNDGTPVDLSPLQDHDWYEVGGTAQSDAITDQIYTQGRVGIGTNTPTRELHVRSALTYVAMFESTGNNAGIAIPNAASTVSTQAIRSSGNDIQIINDAVEMLHIGGDLNDYGNVGIGTTAPNSKLHVLENQDAPTDIKIENRNNTANALPRLYFQGQLAGDYGYLGLFPASSTVTGIADQLVLATGSTVSNGLRITTQGQNIYFSNGLGGGASDIMFIDGVSRNVGIGTTNPLEKLQVKGNIAIEEGGTFLKIRPHPNFSGVKYNYNIGGGGHSHFVSLDNTGNSFDTIMHFRHDVGRVGIGTTNPTEKLEIQGSVKIVDGTEGNQKVLTSDATGKGSWKALKPAFTPLNGNIPSGTLTVIPPSTTTIISGSVTITDAGLYYLTGNAPFSTNVPANSEIYISLFRNGTIVEILYNNTGGINNSNYIWHFTKYLTPGNYYVRVQNNSTNATATVSGINFNFSDFIDID